MVDGLVAAMQAHDGPIDPLVLARAEAVHPALTPGELRDLLTEPTHAPLGCVRLLVARGAGVMWLLSDDQLVALDVRITGDEPL